MADEFGAGRVVDAFWKWVEGVLLQWTVRLRQFGCKHEYDVFTKGTAQTMVYCPKCGWHDEWR